ncbi:MAG: DnaD domain protein [Dehalococcoidales bacterium]
MEEFKGFPRSMEFTPLPNLFFSKLLPAITDITELKVTLYVLAVLYRKRGYPCFVTVSELLGRSGLVKILANEAEPVAEVLRRTLKMAAERGTLLHVEMEKDEVTEDAYFLNTESNRGVVEKVSRGEIELGGGWVGRQAAEPAEELPNIYALYEQNIGLLTPMIAEQLKDAEQVYPEGWIKNAFKEAVTLNKRNWRYIARILESWSTEGKKDGAYQRYSEADPDKYIKGKYGHMVRR